MRQCKMKKFNGVCVRCGESDVDLESKCHYCGEDAVMTVEEVTDLLNEIYLNTNDNESFREWVIRMNDGE